jgi:hypothetical protein
MQPLFVGRAASCRGKMAGRTLLGRGALIHSRYDIGRREPELFPDKRTASAGQPKPWQPMLTILLQSVGHRQVHYRAPISRNTWCAQACRGRATTLFAIATAGGGGSFARGWMAVAGRGSRAHCSQRSSPPRKCSGGLRFRQMLHRDQPATAAFQANARRQRKLIAFNASEHFFKFFPVQSLRLAALVLPSLDG